MGLLLEAVISREAAELARELRQKRRTRAELKNVRSVERFRPWQEIADELARQGHGRHSARAVAEAVGSLPIEGHQLAPAPAAELERLEASWRQGWAEEFPGEPWPGLEDARRRIRLKLFGGPLVAAS